MDVYVQLLELVGRFEEVQFLYDTLERLGELCPDNPPVERLLSIVNALDFVPQALVITPLPDRGYEIMLELSPDMGLKTILSFKGEKP